MLILGRVSGLFLVAPIFASRQIPAVIKIAIIILLSGLISYFIPLDTRAINTSALMITALVIEIFVGFTIGFIIYNLFAAIQLAGQLLDMQMGFGMVNVLDPQSGMQVPLMGNFIYLIALMIYLLTNGHHYLLSALVQSYETVPVLGLHMDQSFMSLLIRVTLDMFIIAIKISAPVVMALLLADISMGFIARTVPQMNVFIVGLPLKIIVGLIVLISILPVYLWFFSILFNKFLEYLQAVLISIGN